MIINGDKYVPELTRRPSSITEVVTSSFSNLRKVKCRSEPFMTHEPTVSSIFISCIERNVLILPVLPSRDEMKNLSCRNEAYDNA